MDSPDASVGAMDAPNEAPECGDDSSTILGKRPAENKAVESCFNGTVSVERSPLHVLRFFETWRARDKRVHKTEGPPLGPRWLIFSFRG